MAVMQPGSLTGVYYIPVGNLPWNLSWMRLKDHARNRQPDGSALAILYAHVYTGQKSHCGWVSVRGLGDFRAAVNHLNSVAIEDPPRSSRILQADDRNENTWVMLREDFPQISSSIRLRESRDPPWQFLPQYPFTPNPQIHSEWSQQHRSASATPFLMPPSFPEISYESSYPYYNLTQTFNGFPRQREYFLCTQSGMLISPMPPPMSPMSPQVYAFPSRQQPEPIPQLLTPHRPQMVSFPQSQPVIFPPQPVSQGMSQQRTFPGAVKAVKTEARKIIITGLPPTATQKVVEELIQSVSSTACPSRRQHHSNPTEGTRYYLQHLELAKNPDGSTKGHAFAVLESQATAKSTIDALNGVRWQNRRLHARFAKEGVESSSHGTRHGKSMNTGPSCLHNPYGAVGEPYVPRTTYDERQYRYVGSNTGMAVDYIPTAQFLNIQIDYRGQHSPSSSSPSLSKERESVYSNTSLSSDGEKERVQSMLSNNSGTHTPVVVDGSSCGKKSR